jgi:hypothetical protein
MTRPRAVAGAFVEHPRLRYTTADGKQLGREATMSKRDFLDNLRVARNLFVHGGASTDGRRLDPAALTRAAIWLTPSSVKGFRVGDFPELGTAQQRALADAVQEFERVAKQVPPDGPATDQQFNDAKAALEGILSILGNYLPNHEEAAQIRTALATLDFPPWVLNWDYEVGSDEDGGPAVWITLYADERGFPPDQFGRRAIEMLPKLRSALTTAGIRRWPYIRMRTAREYKAG